MLYNIHTRQWDDELLALGIPRSMLPEVARRARSTARSGRTCSAAGIPIAGIAGDQQAALFGQTCFSRGLAKNTYGTGCFMLMNTGTKPSPPRHKLLTTWPGKLGGQTEYALEGSVFIARRRGAVAARRAGDHRSAAEVEALAERAGHRRRLPVPAFAGWAPRIGTNTPAARSPASRAARPRATSRAPRWKRIAFQMADILQAMQSGLGHPAQGAARGRRRRANNLLMQFQADLLGVPVVRPRSRRRRRLGAAYLAGLAVGGRQIR